MCERIIEIISEQLSVAVSSPETDLIAGGVIDSLALVTLLVEVEHEFGVVIPLEELELERIQTVARLAAWVQELRADDAPVSISGEAPA